MKNLFLLLFCSVFIFSCGNKNEDGMAAHCKDPEFKKAHEIPEELQFKPSGNIVEYETPDGKKASLYEVKVEGSNNYIFVIHEWWGLNDHIKQEAERLSKELGVNAYALDMYDGKVATERDSAAAYMKSVSEGRGNAIVNGALAMAGDDSKVTTIGWCFGGGWSLNTAILAGEQTAGCVIYYGMPTDDLEKLGKLKSDVLGIFATEDGWITPEVIESFEDNMKKVDKKYSNHWYKAEHAFANPSSPRYHEESAQAANTKTMEYLKSKL